MSLTGMISSQIIFMSEAYVLSVALPLINTTFSFSIKLPNELKQSLKQLPQRFLLDIPNQKKPISLFLRSNLLTTRVIIPPTIIKSFLEISFFSSNEKDENSSSSSEYFKGGVLIYRTLKLLFLSPMTPSHSSPLDP